VQILTVGQSDHDKDAGETAAGGGAQPSGQDLRATMQRKGEPRGGPAGTKAQSQVLFSRNTASLCLVQPFPGCGGGAFLESNEKFGAMTRHKAKLRERNMNRGSLPAAYPIFSSHEDQVYMQISFSFCPLKGVVRLSDGKQGRSSLETHCPISLS
jgi:hypothetical protein